MRWKVVIYGPEGHELIRTVTDDIERVRELAAAAIVLQLDMEVSKG